MDTRTREILMKNDSATDLEYPPGFNWEASMAAIRALRLHAEKVLGQALELDDQVQDASFFAELFVVTAMAFKIALRFSTFGRMATVRTNSAASDLGECAVTRLVSLFGAHGFCYVDPQSLSEPYDGELKGLGGEATWWHRFFDYM